MRKITQESVNAFYNRAKFNKGNMTVTESFGVIYLRLHGNIIAELYNTGVVKICDGGWQSNTTKERLNGLHGVSVVQKNFQWYLNGKEWDGSLTELK